MSGAQSPAEASRGTRTLGTPLQAVCGPTVGEERASRSGRVTPPHACSGCDATWTGLAVCHCSADGCHETFAAVGLFDKHRAQYGEHGICRRPADLVTAAGGPVMFFRDGIWRGPELTEEAKLARFGRAS